MVTFCKSPKCLKGKTAIITGANSGIGYEAALELAKRGCRVIMACRNVQKAEEARRMLVEATGNDNIVIKQIDLSSLSSVRNFARDVTATEDRLDLLINNAGNYNSEDKITEDGLQLEMATNYFSHFLLTMLLLDLLKKSAPSRVINVSSIMARFHGNLKIDELNKHKGKYNMYSKSKLCQIYFTQEFAKRFEGSGVTMYSLHPGAVATPITTRTAVQKCIVPKISKTPEEGAQTTIYLALEDGVEKYNGQHFVDCKRVEPYSSARSEKNRTMLWEVSGEMVGLTQK